MKFEIFMVLNYFRREDVKIVLYKVVWYKYGNENGDWDL